MRTRTIARPGVDTSFQPRGAPEKCAGRLIWALTKISKKPDFVRLGSVLLSSKAIRFWFAIRKPRRTWYCMYSSVFNTVGMYFSRPNYNFFKSL